MDGLTGISKIIEASSLPLIISVARSEKILTDSQKNHPIKIINMSRKFGIGACILAGFELAKGDAIIYMDSDLQDPPEIIPELIKKFEDGADVVHTKRTKRLGESFFRMFLKSSVEVMNIFNFFVPFFNFTHKFQQKKCQT